MSQSIRGQGNYLVFPIGQKNTNLVEDIEILPPVKFRWILFNGLRKKVKSLKVYAGRTEDGGGAMIIAHVSLASCELKLEANWIELASCKVMLKSLQRFWRRSRVKSLRRDGGGRVVQKAPLSLQSRFAKNRVNSLKIMLNVKLFQLNWCYIKVAFRQCTIIKL